MGPKEGVQMRRRNSRYVKQSTYLEPWWFPILTLALLLLSRKRRCSGDGGDGAHSSAFPSDMMDVNAPYALTAVKMHRYQTCTGEILVM